MTFKDINLKCQGTDKFEVVTKVEGQPDKIEIKTVGCDARIMPPDIQRLPAPAGGEKEENSVFKLYNQLALDDFVVR